MANYYSWNVQALVNWLSDEFGSTEQHSIQEILGIPADVIQTWYSNSNPIITLFHIRSIANYRGWSLRQTLNWLEIHGTHLQHLITLEIDELNQGR
jgi:hypothetical protein